MLTLQHKIRIQLQHPKSDFLLKGVISIQLQKDIHILADRAIITLVLLGSEAKCAEATLFHRF